MATEGPKHDVDLVAFNELAELLQRHLRVELVVLADQFDWTAGNLAAVLVKIDLDTAERGFAEYPGGLAEGIEHADLDWSGGLREHSRQTCIQAYDGARCNGGQ